MLQGRNGIIFGVANKRSIAFACAQVAAAQGARLILTYQGERLADGCTQLAAGLPNGAIALPCDVGSDEGIDASFVAIRERMPHVDFAVHSIAFAQREELEGEYLATSRQGFALAHDISAYSFTALAQRLQPLMSEGGALVTMTYLGAERVVPHYNVMGLAKASLEASVRYLAADLGPRGIRVNAISAGPIRTLAASGISDFNSVLELAKTRSPLRRNIDATEVAEVSLFLVSDLSRAVTGEVLHVDGGFHITAM
jgi:enoyl-[acyl-carrier protein] reductase I